MAKWKSRWDEIKFNKMLNELDVSGLSSEDIKSIQDIIEERADNKPFLRLARWLLERHQYLLSIKVARRCIELFPGTVFAYIILGSCLFFLGDEEKSTFVIMHAAILIRRHEKRLIYSAMGEDIDIPDIPIIAVLEDDYLPSPNKINPAGGEVAQEFYNLGCRCLDERVFVEAEVCFRLALIHDRTYWQANANYAATLLHQRRYYEAFPELFYTLTDHPNDEIILYHLAVIFLIFDYPVFANICLHQALIINPDYKNAQVMQRTIDINNAIFSDRERIDSEVWGASRLSLLAIDPDARKSIISAEQIISGGSFTEESLYLSALRNYTAGLEKEFRMAMEKLLSNASQGSSPIEFTLGSIPKLFAFEAIDLLTNNMSTLNKVKPKYRIILTEQCHLDEQEVQMLVNITFSLKPIRNKVAHGEHVPASLVIPTRNLVKAGLLLLTKCRLNYAAGKATDCLITICQDLNRSVTHWYHEKQINVV